MSDPPEPSDSSPRPASERRWEVLDEGGSGRFDLPVSERTATGPLGDPRPSRMFGREDRRVMMLLAGIVVLTVLSGLLVPGLANRPDFRARCESLSIEPIRALIGPQARLDGFFASSLSSGCEFTTSPDTAGSDQDEGTDMPQARLNVAWSNDTHDRTVWGRPTEVEGARSAQITLDDPNMFLQVDTETARYVLSGYAAPGQPLTEAQLTAAVGRLLPELARHRSTEHEVRNAVTNPCRGAIERAAHRHFPDPNRLIAFWGSSGNAACSVVDPVSGEWTFNLTWTEDSDRGDFVSNRQTYSGQERRAAREQASDDEIVIADDGSRALGHRNGVTVSAEIDNPDRADRQFLIVMVETALDRAS